MKRERAARLRGKLLRGFTRTALGFSLVIGCATGGELERDDEAQPSGRSGASGRGGSSAGAGRGGTAGVWGAGASGGSGGAAGGYAPADGASGGGYGGTSGADAAAGGVPSAGSAGTGGVDAAAGSGGSGGSAGSAGSGGKAGTSGSAGSAGVAGSAGKAGSAGSAGAVGTAGAAGVDAGAGDGCVPVTEICNGLDDDCDGTRDDVSNPSAECGQRNPTAANVASWQCSNGACAIVSCAAGYANCDASASTGCETNTNSDPAHCGNCTTVCSGTTPTCTNGGCTGNPPVGGCAPGFVICDTFEDGVADGWSVNGGSWSVVSDGSFVYRASGAGISYRVANLGDQTVEARMKIIQFGGTSGAYRAGIVARFTDSSNFYTLQIDASGNLRVLKGASTTGCSDVPSGVSPLTNTWVTLKLSVSGPSNSVRIVSSVDGAQKHDCTLTSGTLVSGSAGVTTVGANTQAEFDNFGVWSP